ncbi:MAG: hypothetical protein KF863_06195 [Rubrivivax sp.]|nr:hypothetical protein [Rubrivivax sp.]
MSSTTSAPLPAFAATLLALLAALLLWACSAPPQHGATACAAEAPAPPIAPPTAPPAAKPATDDLPDPGEIPPLRFAQ